ncbi:MAG TPA: hypothetical protein PKW41_00325, partial [Clostridia bacterium]|nr:hypothetical protein [Clostridia bacterium]
ALRKARRAGAQQRGARQRRKQPLPSIHSGPFLFAFIPQPVQGHPPGFPFPSRPARLADCVEMPALRDDRRKKYPGLCAYLS